MALHRFSSGPARPARLREIASDPQDALLAELNTAQTHLAAACRHPRQRAGRTAALATRICYRGISRWISIPWLALASVFCCICMAVPLIHLVPLGISAGCSPQTAAGLLLSAMVAAVFGRLFFGWLADRVGGLTAYRAVMLSSDRDRVLVHTNEQRR